MYRLLSTMYSIAFVCIVGVLMTAALVMGYDDAWGLIVATILGAVISAPVAWVITKKLQAIPQDGETSSLPANQAPRS